TKKQSYRGDAEARRGMVWSISLTGSGEHTLPSRQSEGSGTQNSKAVSRHGQSLWPDTSQIFVCLRFSVPPCLRGEICRLCPPPICAEASLIVKLGLTE